MKLRENEWLYLLYEPGTWWFVLGFVLAIGLGYVAGKFAAYVVAYWIW